MLLINTMSAYLRVWNVEKVWLFQVQLLDYYIFPHKQQQQQLPQEFHRVFGRCILEAPLSQTTQPKPFAIVLTWSHQGWHYSEGSHRHHPCDIRFVLASGAALRLFTLLFFDILQCLQLERFWNYSYTWICMTEKFVFIFMKFFTPIGNDFNLFSV